MKGIFKSSLSCALPLAAAIVFLAPASVRGADNEARSPNTHAIVKVISPLTNTIVATPWTFYTPDGAPTTNLPIDRLVRPTNLTTGDMVIALTNNVKYAAWRLVETDEDEVGGDGRKSRRWEAVTTVQRVNADAAARTDIWNGDHQDMTQQRGYGLWVYRQNPLELDENGAPKKDAAGNVVPKPFYLYGQLASGEAKVKVYGKDVKIDEPVFTMLANPHLNQTVKLNDIFAGYWDHIGPDDKIIIPTDHNQHIYCLRLGTRSGPAKSWCYARMTITSGGLQKTEYVTDIPFDPHIGFWYVRHSIGTSGKEDFDFTWPVPAQPASDQEQPDATGNN